MVEVNLQRAFSSDSVKELSRAYQQLEHGAREHYRRMGALGPASGRKQHTSRQIPSLSFPLLLLCALVHHLQNLEEGEFGPMAGKTLMLNSLPPLTSHQA